MFQASEDSGLLKPSFSILGVPIILRHSPSCWTFHLVCFGSFSGRHHVMSHKNRELAWG